jgi:hypothetical protein
MPLTIPISWDGRIRHRNIPAKWITGETHLKNTDGWQQLFLKLSPGCRGLKGIETFQIFVKHSNSVYIFTGRLPNDV